MKVFYQSEKPAIANGRPPRLRQFGKKELRLTSMIWAKKVLSFALIVLFGVCFTSVVNADAYIRGASAPWGQTTNEAAMNAVFGAGNWDDLRMADGAGPFTPGAHDFIFLEGGDSTANELNAFLAANQFAIENYVSSGGTLLLNSAPNQGGNINFGFGGVTLTYPSFTGSVTADDPAHPVFNGPFTPVTTNYTGSAFGHAIVGGGVSPIIVGVPGGFTVLAELNFGAGLVLFGGMTTTNFHSPQPEAANLRANIIAYTLSGRTIRIAGVGANFGNQAANTVCSSGDLNCTIVRINEATFNSMTPAQLRAAYDVMIFTWASSGTLNGDWATRIKPYLDLGGGVIWEDQNNIGDLAPEIVGSQFDSGGNISVIAAVPGLTDGITDNFINSHSITTLWSASFSPFLRDNSNGNTVGLYGGTSVGCMVITGPDQDYHSARGAGGAAGNQYNLLVNEISWVSACAGFVNTPPEANDDAFGTLEDTDLNQAAPGVLDNDTDGDSDPVTAVLDSTTSNGSLTLNADGSFDYDPDLNYCGSDSFTYHVNDGTDDSNIATVTITVTCVNDAPSFVTLGDQTVPEDSGPQSVPGFAVASPGGGADEAGQTFAYNIVGNSFPGLFSTAPAISASGELTYTSGPNAYGSSTITVSVTDSGGTDNGGVDTSAEQSFNINITPVNDAPVANDDAYDAVEDILLVIAAPGVLSNDTDVDGDTLSVFSNTPAAHGTVVVYADGSFTYLSNLNYCGPDSFTYVATDDPPATPPAMQSGSATVSLTVACVNDPPVVTSVVPAAQSSDYSDNIGTVVITVEDVDDTSTSLLESNEPPLSAAGLSLASTGCTPVITESPAEDGSVCTWTYDGQVLDPGDNVHGIVFTPSDADGAGTTGTHILTIEPEDATVELDAGNEVAVQVEEDGGNSGEFHLFFSAWETDPDLAGGSPLPGDLNEMVPFIDLIPVGPGGPESGTCSFMAPLPVPFGGYGEEAVFDCVFDEVPVNTYEINAWVDGASVTTRYYVGADDGVLSVFDPSLGFTTGGGWFYWPGTADPDLTTCGEDGYPGDKTNFGFNMKYNKKMTNVQGSLLLQRHTVDANCEGAGKFRVKSNALDGLSIGGATDVAGDYGWAAFGGKSVFSEPGLEGSGNHPFLVYVEDHDDQGCNQDPSDEFWIEVKDKDGIVVLEVNGPDSEPAGDDGADGDDEAIQCGNIIVPHQTGGKGKN